MKRLKFTLFLLVISMIVDTPLSTAAISKGSLCSLHNFLLELLLLLFFNDVIPC